MSAFEVSPETLFTIAAHSVKRFDLEAIQANVEKLYKANLASLAVRYGDEDHGLPAPRIDFHSATKGRCIAPVAAIKATQCFDYQACEVDNYRDTVAAKIVEAARFAAIRRLPGYDAAAWG